MKTMKLIVGIISIVLAAFILFQSFFAGIGDALAEEGGTSGASGILVSILMLISGIVAIAARKSRGAGLATAIFYIVAGIIAVTASGSFADLVVWGVLCFIFAALFLLSFFFSPKAKPDNKA